MQNPCKLRCCPCLLWLSDLGSRVSDLAEQSINCQLYLKQTSASTLLYYVGNATHHSSRRENTGVLCQKSMSTCRVDFALAPKTETLVVLTGKAMSMSLNLLDRYISDIVATAQSWCRWIRRIRVTFRQVATLIERQQARAGHVAKNRHRAEQSAGDVVYHTVHRFAE